MANRAARFAGDKPGSDSWPRSIFSNCAVCWRADARYRIQPWRHPPPSRHPVLRERDASLKPLPENHHVCKATPPG